MKHSMFIKLRGLQDAADNGEFVEVGRVADMKEYLGTPRGLIVDNGEVVGYRITTSTGEDIDLFIEDGFYVVGFYNKPANRASGTEPERSHKRTQS